MDNNKKERVYKTIMLIVLTIAITFIVTSCVIYNSLGKDEVKYIVSSDNISTTFKTFHDFIQKNYLGEMNESDMLESAIKGYVKGLNDEYSEYITKDDMKEYMQDTTGKYVGIGVYIADDIENNQVLVLMPIKGSPAEKAGIKSEDVIRKVDGVEYKGEDLTACSNALKSQEGTVAKIEILRNGEIINVEVPRETIKMNHIDSQVINSNIGYMQITTFDEGCYNEFVENWEELKSQNVSSLIIDLRNNGGGIVNEATNVADIMVDKDRTLLITAGKNRQEALTKSKKDKVIDVPIVVLVNENTASASEILTAALRENNNNVKVVGKTTFGKGVIQTIYTLTDGSGLKLTTDEYYTPNHNTIHKVGIKPDYEVEFPEDENLYLIDQKDDPQLQKAIELLK